MFTVTSFRALRSRTPLPTSGSSWNGRVAPRKVWTGGRTTIAGSSSKGGTSSSLCFQPASSSDRTSSVICSRCHEAKSAYWSGACGKGGGAPTEGIVERRDLAVGHLERPAVDGDMMDVQPEEVIAWPEPEQPCPEDGAAPRSKHPLGLRGEELLRLGLALLPRRGAGGPRRRAGRGVLDDDLDGRPSISV